jgi:RimJ/RimL family protein N-acetyltransferase
VDEVELVSERLALRPVSEGDLDFYDELRNRPEILARPGVEPRPRSDIERQLRGWIDRWQEHGFGSWTVFERESGERLGRVELDPFGPGWEGISPGEIELGFVVHPTRWNRGIATEAAGLVVADCFTRVGLGRLIALTTTDNKASLRALEKLGMRHCGQTRYEGDSATYEVFELVRPAREPQIARTRRFTTGHRG